MFFDQIQNSSNTKRILVGLALSILSGLMLTAAFAPYDLWPLAFIAFVPMILAQFKIMPSKLSSLASAFMIATWLFIYFGPSFFVGGIMLALPAIGFALNYFTEKTLRNFHENTRYQWFIIYGAVNWVGFEILRTFIPGIGTWGFINYTLYSQPWLIQPVSIFSIYGLSLMIMFVNYLVGQRVLLWIENRNSDQSSRFISSQSTRRWTYAISAAWALWIGLSLFQYSQAPENPETIRVAAIQLGETEVAFSHPDMDAQERLDKLADLTRQAAAEGAEIITWSELALPFDPQLEYTDQLKALASEVDAHLVLPYGVFEDDGLRNESIFLSPDGEFSQAYAKAHPVLFAGEPYGLNVGTFPVYESSLGTLANIICYDLNYTDVTRKWLPKAPRSSRLRPAIGRALLKNKTCTSFSVPLRLAQALSTPKKLSTQLSSILMATSWNKPQIAPPLKPSSSRIYRLAPPIRSISK